ncbi:hypothetical protein Tco_1123953 [Tanacetum coccineum]|uniref:Uncharacterized protein n=1 Tax=Tanacetum coccineum TaxID=301880 RepID=A0ABQ5J4T9_9ASTR
MGMGKAKGSKKGAGSLGSSSSMNDEALARLMISELTMHNERSMATKKEECLAFLEIRRTKSYNHWTGDTLKQMEEIRAGIKEK